MIKYRYAFDQEENIINVDAFDRKEELGEFHCIGCGKELIARLGKIRIKHFAHKHDSNCSVETYLHKLAKTTFYNLYKDCLKNSKPFILEYTIHHFCDFYEDKFKIDCDLGSQHREFDLISYFTNIALEEKDGNLIPDVRIYNPTNEESIYIEMAVTHLSEPQKISSGNRIIEFLINQEEDLELFQNRRISKDKDQINRYNFKGEDKKQNFCKGNCTIKKNAFIVYDSGKSIIAEKKLNELSKMLETRNILDCKVTGVEETYSSYRPFKFIENVISTYESGIAVKNCFLCRYHATNKNISTKNEEPIFCKFLKKTCISNYAADCEYFKPDKAVYAEYIEE